MVHHMLLIVTFSHPIVITFQSKIILYFDCYHNIDMCFPFCIRLVCLCLKRGADQDAKDKDGQVSTIES